MGRIILCVIGCLGLLQNAQAQARPRSPLGNSNQDFGGIRTFLRAPYIKDLSTLDADIAIVGMPFDQGTSYRPGQRYGPRDIREASLAYAFGPQNGFYYIDTGETLLKGKRWADLGDVDVIYTDIPTTSQNLTTVVRGILNRGAFPVVLGGDHSLTFPAVRAFDTRPLTVIDFDAHLDSYGDGNPNYLDHGAWLQQVGKLPGIKFVQVGMRGIVNDARGVAHAKALGSTIITAERIHREGVRAIIDALPALGNIYISIDIDVLDPSLAPGNGASEVGGLTFQQLDEFLTQLPKKGRIVGLDVSEVNPFFDPAGVTALTAARLVIDVVGAAFRDR